MPADLPIFNGDMRPGEEEQSLDVPTVDTFLLHDAPETQFSMLGLSTDLSSDLIDIAAFVRDEHLLSEQGGIESDSPVEIVTLARVEELPDVERLAQASQLKTYTIDTIEQAGNERSRFRG